MKTIKYRYEDLQRRHQIARELGQHTLQQLVCVEEERNPLASTSESEQRASRIFQIGNQYAVMYLKDRKIEFWIRPDRENNAGHTKVFNLGFLLARLGDDFRVNFYIETLDSQERKIIEVNLREDDVIDVLNLHAARALHDFLS